jgi:hypothetical protein
LIVQFTAKELNKTTSFLTRTRQDFTLLLKPLNNESASFGGAV